MTLLNYILDNNIVFYSLFTGTVGFIGYKFVSFYLNTYYVDIQTSAWEDYFDRSGQILQIISNNTQKPVFSPVEFIKAGIQANTIKMETGIQSINNPMYGKDWGFIIEYIDTHPSFFLDSPYCNTWLMPNPYMLALLSNSEFWPPLG